MRKDFTTLILLLLALLIGSAPAFADSYQGFVMNNAGTGSAWNQFQVNIYGATFASPGVLTFNGAPWSATFSGSVVCASGPSRTSNLYFTLAFLTSNPTTPFYLDFFQFNNGVLLTGETTEAIWNGQSWTFKQMPGLTPTPVPEAEIPLLFGISILFGGVAKRWLLA